MPPQEKKIRRLLRCFPAQRILFLPLFNTSFLRWLCLMFCLQLSAAPLPGVHPPGTGLLHKNSVFQVLFLFFFPSLTYERRTNVVITVVASPACSVALLYHHHPRDSPFFSQVLTLTVDGEPTGYQTIARFEK